MGGGQTARWIVTDVWPQWRCSKDPEDQTASDLDPAWFTVSRALLEEAARQGVKVVVSLANLSNGGFAATSTDSVQIAKDAGEMAAHRRQATGQDGYSNDHAAMCSGVPGYYGHTDQAALFTDVGLRAHLRQRDVTMARYLAAFPALEAIELFNEPDMAVTAKLEFWLTVKDFRQAMHGASAEAARISIISGAAAWNRAIVDAAKSAGALEQEPFITVHTYDDYVTKGKSPSESLQALLTYLRSIVPVKPIVVAEIGGGTPVHTFAQFRRMLDTIMNLYIHSQVGVWVWGNWFHEPVETDFALVFNQRSVVGPAFRPYFFADREVDYAEPKIVNGTDLARNEGAAVPVVITRTSEIGLDPWMNGRWVIKAGDTHLTGFSRAGVFPRPFRGPPGLFADPPPTLFFSQGDKPPRWASVRKDDAGWELEIFACLAEGSASTQLIVATPTELLGLAEAERRNDLSDCEWSRPMFKSHL